MYRLCARIRTYDAKCSLGKTKHNRTKKNQTKRRKKKPPSSEKRFSIFGAETLCIFSVYFSTTDSMNIVYCTDLCDKWKNAQRLKSSVKSSKHNASSVRLISISIGIGIGIGTEQIVRMHFVCKQISFWSKDFRNIFHCWSAWAHGAFVSYQLRVSSVCTSIYGTHQTANIGARAREKENHTHKLIESARVPKKAFSPFRVVFGRFMFMWLRLYSVESVCHFIKWPKSSYVT